MEKKLKSSRFNHLILLKNGNGVLYNFLWRSMVELEKSEVALYREFMADINDVNLLKNNSSPIVSELVNNKFFLSDDFDEIAYYTDLFNSCFHQDSLVLLVLPTLKCNFDCPYCYENMKESSMSTTIVSALERWIVQRLKNKTYFNIRWFGGEPTLSLQHIKTISEKVIDYCNKSAIKLEGHITTNGYLLNESSIKLLEDCKITNMQITLDGDREKHNQTRYLKNGSGTFEKIFENIELVAKLTRYPRPLTLRVNVSDNNYASIQNLLKKFSSRVKEKSRIYFHWLNDPECLVLNRFVTEKNRTYERLACLYQKAEELGFEADPPTNEIRFNYCEVDYENHFVISPTGHIFLCSHKFEPEDAVGHIIDNPEVWESADYMKWIHTNPLDDEECLHCKVLPVCNGGCRKARYAGTKSCIEEKESIDNYVLDIYSKQINLI